MVSQAKVTGAEPPEMHYLLGEIAIYRGEYETGVSELRREVQINPTFSFAWYRLGDAYSRLLQWHEAAEALKKALWLNRDFSSPYVLLGKVYAELNQNELAAGVLGKALSMDPNNGRSLSAGECVSQAGSRGRRAAAVGVVPETEEIGSPLCAEQLATRPVVDWRPGKRQTSRGWCSALCNCYAETEKCRTLFPRAGGVS